MKIKLQISCDVPSTAKIGTICYYCTSALREKSAMWFVLRRNVEAFFAVSAVLGSALHPKTATERILSRNAESLLHYCTLNSNKNTNFAIL